MASQVLYRFWSDADELLYVGITARPWERWKQHRGEKPWWDEVAAVTLESFETRAEVKAAETQAIKTEGPRYNIAQMPKDPGDEPAAHGWDGKHVPQVACVGDFLYCSCCPPDWTTAPDRQDFNWGPIKDRDDFDERDSTFRSASAAWDEEQARIGVYIHPEDYADHVIESVAAERWAEAMDAARAGVKTEERQRKRSAKFVLEVWPETCHQYLPRQWQSYVRGWLDAGLTRDDVREALLVALEAQHVPMERMWKYATGVLGRMQRELNEAAEAHLQAPNGGA